MQRSKKSIVSRVATLAAFMSICQVAAATDSPYSKEVQNMLDFQCHGATTVKQAEANYAKMGRGFTDRHPVMECLKKKIEELKAAGK